METLIAARETLGDLRRLADKTTREAGAALGLTQPRITQIEQRGTTDIEHIQGLADFYGMSFERVREAAAYTRANPSKR